MRPGTGLRSVVVASRVISPTAMVPIYLVDLMMAISRLNDTFFWFFRAFGMVYSRRFFVVYFVWIFKVMGLDCLALRDMFIMPFAISSCRVSQRHRTLFYDREHRGHGGSFFVFLRHRVLLETGLIKNGPLKPLTISS